MVNLSDDELKILRNILSQLSYKLDQAKLVLGIDDKLAAAITEPDLPTPDATADTLDTPVDAQPN